MQPPSYQRYPVMDALKSALREQCLTGEYIIWRDAFRWHSDQGVLSNQYEMFDLQTVAENIGCDVIADFRHAAIVRPVVFAAAEPTPADAEARR